jgi:hypothetical protein
MRTADELKLIAKNGGGFTIDARSFSISEMQEIVSHARASGARIMIINASHLSTRDLAAIAAQGKGAVDFLDL